MIDFYDHGVQPSRDPRERDALVVYLESLTDSTFLSAEKFSNPFGR